jgi:uncharacterized membrane protein YcaP (DUF421 family)
LLLRTLLVALAAYAAVVAMVRVSGKRTLAKWNAFDLVVTVALGSSLATMVLSRQTPLAQGVVAFAVLVLLQLCVSWLSVRVRAFERLVKSEPALLVRDGRPDEAAMRRERVSLAEVRAAVRSKGLSRLEDAAAVVLETDGSISIITRLEPPASALGDVKGFH